MSIERKYPPRLSVDLEDEHEAILKRLPKGFRKPLFHALIEEIGRIHDEDPTVLAAIILGHENANRLIMAKAPQGAGWEGDIRKPVQSKKRLVYKKTKEKANAS